MSTDYPHNPDHEKPDTPEGSTENLESSGVRQISKRKILYVELDEEITSVFDKISFSNYQDVYLVVPERAVILQSVVNLQILKKKVGDLKKSLSLITRDPIGTKLAHQAGIPVFDQIARKSTPMPVPLSIEDEEMVSRPIAAMSNEVEDDSPQRLTQKKLSIFEVVRDAKEKRIFSLKFLKQKISSRKEQKLFSNEPSRFALGAPSKKTLGTLVVASLSILLIISYVALPGATVTLTPKSNVVEQSANITLANANVYGTNPSLEGSHVMVAYPISVSLEETVTYDATGQIFQGTNAGGTVTLINERSTAWPLVAFSRLQTEEGMIFRTQEAVTVPAATDTGFGTIDVTVLADEEDVYGRVMGANGNIGPSSFFLPGLREDSQKELYGRSSGTMTGGSTEVTMKITQEDLDAAEGLIENLLKAGAEDAIWEEINRRNVLNDTSLQLLTGYDAIQISAPSISVPTYLLDASQDQFEASGRVTVSGYSFDYTEFLSIMTEELETRKSPDKQLLKIDEDSISYEIFEVE
ncbi:MAG: hypothetical protein Q8P27_02180, partial [Candidatus Peregrinibacteria bacterium]|nr:hypothetical protein [Candidatus Peregrinibacteria bacterium]